MGDGVLPSTEAILRAERDAAVARAERLSQPGPFVHDPPADRDTLIAWSNSDSVSIGALANTALTYLDRAEAAESLLDRARAVLTPEVIAWAHATVDRAFAYGDSDKRVVAPALVALADLLTPTEPPCVTCNDSGIVPHTGRGGDGFDPCPDCGPTTEPEGSDGD